MRLEHGKIGGQETISVLSISLVSTAVIMVDSRTLYENGNLSYLSIPLSLVASLVIFLILAKVMEKTGTATLSELAQYVFGKVGDILCTTLITFGLIFNSYIIISSFIDVLHSLVYVVSTQEPVTIWILASVVFIAFLGMECVGRVSKIFGVFLGVLMLLSIAFSVSGYEIYRLFPIPMDYLPSKLLQSGFWIFKSLPAFLALLNQTKGLHGLAYTRKCGLIGGIISIAFAIIIQTAIGTAFSYSELLRIYLPIFRINMKLMRESYFLRLDKIEIFLWMIGIIISAAFYLYSAAFAYTKTWTKYDVRPAVASFSAVIACMMAAEFTNKLSNFNEIIHNIENIGSIVLVGFFSLLALSGIIKRSIKERKAIKNA